jgi:hypothetical protein
MHVARARAAIAKVCRCRTLLPVHLQAVRFCRTVGRCGSLMAGAPT